MANCFFKCAGTRARTLSRADCSRTPAGRSITAAAGRSITAAGLFAGRPRSAAEGRRSTGPTFSLAFGVALALALPFGRPFAFACTFAFGCGFAFAWTSAFGRGAAAGPWRASKAASLVVTWPVRSSCRSSMAREMSCAVLCSKGWAGRGSLAGTSTSGRTAARPAATASHGAGAAATGCSSRAGAISTGSWRSHQRERLRVSLTGHIGSVSRRNSGRRVKTTGRRNSGRRGR